MPSGRIGFRLRRTSGGSTRLQCTRAIRLPIHVERLATADRNGLATTTVPYRFRHLYRLENPLCGVLSLQGMISIHPLRKVLSLRGGVYLCVFSK